MGVKWILAVKHIGVPFHHGGAQRGGAQRGGAQRGGAHRWEPCARQLAALLPSRRQHAAKRLLRLVRVRVRVRVRDRVRVRGEHLAPAGVRWARIEPALANRVDPEVLEQRRHCGGRAVVPAVAHSEHLLPHHCRRQVYVLSELLVGAAPPG